MTARLIVGVTSVVVCATAWLGPSLHAADPNRAGVVVRFGDGEIRKMCVAFDDDDDMTGFDLLERTQLDLVVDRGAIGNAVCKIGGDGCSSGDCFCEYPTFWGYWTRDAGDSSWAFSELGSGERTVRDGSLDGWSWGRDGKPAPSKLSFDDVCSAGEARATAEEAEPASRPNYAPFAAIGALIVAAGGVAYSRRRR